MVLPPFRAPCRLVLSTSRRRTAGRRPSAHPAADPETETCATARWTSRGPCDRRPPCGRISSTMIRVAESGSARCRPYRDGSASRRRRADGSSWRAPCGLCSYDDLPVLVFECGSCPDGWSQRGVRSPTASTALRRGAPLLRRGSMMVAHLHALVMRRARVVPSFGAASPRPGIVPAVHPLIRRSAGR